MLCLVGGQGAGKSSFFRLLAIRDEWFSDDLKKLDDDRVYLKLQGHWIIVQLFQVIGKPLVPDCQQAEEAGFSGSLTAHQTEHFLIFGTGPEYSRCV